MRNEILSESSFSEPALERCRSYLVAQLKDRKAQPAARRRHVPGPAITISRESGCGAPEVVEQLAGFLQESGPSGPCPWTVFDRQLMARILQEHNLPREMARYIPEDRRSCLQDRVEEVLWLHPPPWEIGPQSVETILHLVEMGHVIIVGRGCSVITAETPNVFHVRLVAPLAQRIEHVRQTNQLSQKEAAKRVGKEDRGRARYVKSLFGKQIDDALLYHAVINTGLMPYAEAARIIAEGARSCFARAEAGAD